MPTPTSQNKIEVKERDGYREKCFKDAYGLIVKIRCININDKDWNWISNELNFDHEGKFYTLEEIFKEGNDNSTDYVELRYSADGYPLIKETFKRHLDAELRMVSLMRGQNGNN